jgi:peptidoglycan/xylan/chitin deacetylase (PgdA/CDA1 family)
MRANNERDFVGYGSKPPNARWPNGARLALVIVLNVEEGAEPSVPDGDPATETALTDGVREEVPAGTRDFVAESLFEYGSRIGFWRIIDLMVERGIQLTVNACAQALMRNPQMAESIKQHGFDLCCHGDRFVRHFLMTEQDERTAIARAIAGLEQAVGRRPSGWQSRYSPSENTRALLVEHCGLLYDSDSYADDWPYWVKVGEKPHLIIPHSFTNNDNRLATAKLGTANDFYDHLASALRVLYSEGARSPRMMTVSLHSRISGQPARFEAVQKFLDFAAQHEGIWFASRTDVARHWTLTHPAERYR